MGVIQIVENEAVELNIRIHKTSSKGENLKGVGFTLFDDEGNSVKFQQIMEEEGTVKEQVEFFTDANDMLLFPTKVPYGTYTLKETTTPPKYKKADDEGFDYFVHYTNIIAKGYKILYANQQVLF